MFCIFFADVWSAGCVMAELLIGQPIFPDDSGVDQLVEIIKILGTPSKDQIKQMNPNYTEFKFPQIKASPWEKVMTTNMIDLTLFTPIYHVSYFSTRCIFRYSVPRRPVTR